uniref:HABP4_PAI-RBP1 domain-containing protein n=1 Tax=Mesocestoides corti TaxID=53468 RepID=A0A5K3EUK3_MESCO
MADTTLEVPAEEETPVAEVKAAEPEQVPAEEEPKTITLQEYRKKLNASKSKVQLTTKGSRPPNDGENVFSNMVEVHKSKPVEQKVEVLLEDKTTEEVSTKKFDKRFSRRRNRCSLSSVGEDHHCVVVGHDPLALVKLAVVVALQDKLNACRSPLKLPRLRIRLQIFLSVVVVGVEWACSVVVGVLELHSTRIAEEVVVGAVGQTVHSSVVVSEVAAAQEAVRVEP